MRCVKTPTWTPPLRPAAEEISIVVVLPAPLGPRKAKISPLRTSRSIPPTASSPHVRSNILSVTPSGHAALTPSGHAAGGDGPHLAAGSPLLPSGDSSHDRIRMHPRRTDQQCVAGRQRLARDLPARRRKPLGPPDSIGDDRRRGHRRVGPHQPTGPPGRRHHGRNRADRPAGPQHRPDPGVDGLVPDRRERAPAAAPTHPTLRRRSPPQHGRGRNLALVPPAALRDWHPPAAAPTERLPNIEPDPRAAGRAAGECAHPGTTDVAAEAVWSGRRPDPLPGDQARCW